MVDAEPFPLTRSTFIGRQSEAGLLWRQFELAQAGSLRVVLIDGEPGIGKTRLMDFIAQRAAATGAMVLWGSAFEAEGMPPYLPFLQALGNYVRSAPPIDLQRQAGAAASVLGTILPELPARLGVVLHSYPLPPEQARLRLFQAVGDFLGAMTDERALLLSLDDLHWADSASLDLLAFLPRYRPNMRLLVVGSYRQGDAPRHGALQKTLAELSRQRILHRVTIAALTADETARLAAEFLAGPVDSKVSRLLFDHGEGNPFFSEELLRNWVDSGVLVQTEAYWTIQGHVDHQVPAEIMGVVQQRLQRLPAETVDELRTAAIIGRTFDLTLLAEALGQDEEVVEGRLAPALSAQLISASAADRYFFAHDKIRECLYAEVVSARRKRLHGFIGRALETRTDPDEGQRLADLAFHFAHSGDRQRGIAYTRRAAEQALSAYAFEAAMAHTQTALDLAGLRDPERAGMFLELGQAALLANDIDRSLRAFQGALSGFEEAGDRLAAGQAAAELGRAWWRQEAIPQARAAFEQALDLLADHESAETAQVLVDLSGLLALSLHQPDAGLAYGHQALGLARQIKDDRATVAAGRAIGNILVRANRLQEGLAMLEQSLDLALRSDDCGEATECCAGLVIGYAWNTQFEQAGRIGQKQIELALSSHNTYALRHIHSLMAILHGVRAQRTATEHWLAMALSTVEKLENPEPLAFLEFVHGGLLFMWGDYPTAETLLASSIHRLREASPDAVGWYLGYVGMVQAAQGKVAQARECMEELDRLIALLPSGTTAVAEPLNQLAIIALTLGDHYRLGRLHDNLLLFRGQFHDALVDRLLGAMEVLQGDWQAAESSLASAEAVARRENLVWELAHTLTAQADLVLARGGSASAEQARRLLGEAAIIYHQAGNATEESRIRRRLRTLPPQPMTQPAIAYPANLSQREVDVLRLVASGLSNRQISERLFLSEKTVANHLTGIFNKIGADNRAAAAAFALRHGLA